MYYANPTGDSRVHDLMAAGRLGCVMTPGQGSVVPDYARAWMADNGRFGSGWRGDLWHTAWLSGMRPHSARCAFAVAPDVPFDMAATLRSAVPWLYRIREMGYPAALCLQEGATRLPWELFDVLFIAGNDAYKLGLDASRWAREAADRNIPVHMGRVNSFKRIRIAAGFGCVTVDGGHVRRGPAKNSAEVMGWIDSLTRNGAQVLI